MYSMAAFVAMGAVPRSIYFLAEIKISPSTDRGKLTLECVSKCTSQSRTAQFIEQLNLGTLFLLG